jgi:hypothetical protein
MATCPNGGSVTTIQPRGSPDAVAASSDASKGVSDLAALGLILLGGVGTFLSVIISSGRVN